MNAVRKRIHPLLELGCIVLCMGFAALTCYAQTTATTTTHRAVHAATPAPGTAAQTAAAAAPQYKGIWEPMNYPDDITFNSVFFVSDKVGWIAGKGSGGFIMHTADGAQHWDMQIGDPHSTNPGISSLQFIDATHGWAYQEGNQLLRTTDGRTWQPIGSFPSGPTAFRFISAQDGFALIGDFRGSTIFVTHDAGRTWKQAYQAAATMQFSGLTSNVSPYLEDIYFPSPKVGYAVGNGYNDSWSVFYKTSDGGKTWKVIFASTQVGRAAAVFFTDENNGVVSMGNGPVVITADGGQTWRAAQGTAAPVLQFADPEVGWSCGRDFCDVTTDGGKSWLSHNNSFPRYAASYSVPRRDSVYVVSDHGMIYHYHIVQSDYTVPNAVDGALVPSYGGPIVGQLQQMQNQVAALQTQLGGTPTPAPQDTTTAAPSAPPPADADAPLSNQAAPPPASSGGGFSQDTSGQASAGAAPAGQDTSASGGFSQDTSGATQDPNATAAGFSQDASTAPTSTFTQGCCASAIQSLQTVFTSVATAVPQFGTQFKNLNVFFVGLNMLSQMMASAKQIKNDFVALKNAPNAQAALASLADLSKTVQGMSQSITTQFSSLTASNAASDSGALGNQMVGGAGSPGAAGTNGQPGSTSSSGNQTSTPAASTAGSTASSTAQSTGQSATSKGISKLKSRIPPF